MISLTSALSTAKSYATSTARLSWSATKSTANVAAKVAIAILPFASGVLAKTSYDAYKNNDPSYKALTVAAAASAYISLSIAILNINEFFYSKNLKQRNQELGSRVVELEATNRFLQDMITTLKSTNEGLNRELLHDSIETDNTRSELINFIKQIEVLQQLLGQSVSGSNELLIAINKYKYLINHLLNSMGITTPLQLAAFLEAHPITPNLPQQ